MRTLLFASAAVFALGSAAYAQNAPHNPTSGQASNITTADTRSELAPSLPSPGDAGSAEAYLARARQAIRAGRTGEAQEALERAETRLLDRSTVIGTGNMPDQDARVKSVQSALMALGRHDKAGALHDIEMTMKAPSTSMSGGMSGGMMQGTMATTPMTTTPMATITPMPPAIGMGAPPNGGSVAANTQIYSSCGVQPCVEGTPPAAPGGGSGSGPSALRTAPVDSPVATGAGGGTGSKGTAQ